MNFAATDKAKCFMVWILNPNRRSRLVHNGRIRLELQSLCQARMGGNVTIVCAFGIFVYTTDGKQSSISFLTLLVHTRYTKEEAMSQGLTF